MKNYYDILGIPSFEDNQDAILVAYKNGIENIRKKIVSNPKLEEYLIDFTESFLILSDTDLKELYDYSLVSHVESEKLLDGIANKHEEAKQFVEKKRPFIPQKRKKRVWPAILCGLFLLSALGTILKPISQAIYNNREADYIEQLPSFTTPPDWKRHSFADAFSIAIPPSMEIREDLAHFNAITVFQQKGLTEGLSSDEDTYCRVLVEYDTFGNGEVERHDETTYISLEDRDAFRSVCDAELSPWDYIDYPDYQWVDINGTKAIEASYTRTGMDGPVNCKIYLLPNYNEMAKIVIAYRDKDSDMWADDMANIIKTFRWKTPK